MPIANPIGRRYRPEPQITFLRSAPCRFFLTLAVTMAAGIAWLGGTANAQPTRPGRDVSNQMLKEFDANNDGQLDASERSKLRAAMAKRFRDAGTPSVNRREMIKRFDKDGDGRLNEEERLAAMKAGRVQTGQRPGGNPPGTPADRREMIKRFDKNGDGSLDQSERAAAKAEFEKRFAGTDRPGRRRPEAPSPGPPPAGAARRGGDFLKRFDKNGDGKLDDSERAAARRAFAARQGANRPGTAAPSTEKPDTGRVSKAELLKEFDADGNGKLIGEERAAARKAFEARAAEDAKNS